MGKLNNLSDRNKGIVFIILSAFGFAMMSAFIKLSGDLPSIQKTFFRNLVSCIIAFSLILKYKESAFGNKENRKILILRSIFGTLGIILNFYAIDRLVLSDANMLNKLSPFFVIIFSAIFLKEKIKSNQAIAVIIAFIGALFIIKPTLNFAIIPYVAGILGAIFAAAAYTCLRVLGGKEKFYTVVFFFSLFSTVSIFPFAIMAYKSMTIIQFVYLVLGGVFASIGQFGVTLAYKYAPAKEISIFDYSNIIFSAIISILVFNVIPDKYSFIGYIIIFSASYYMFLNNKKTKN
ncbi:membrane protein [Paraclostridium bifermentans]|uniref:DMT family transporter n=1 Tax=Paraclostridium bifermentans TaxID=1490 RepID=UPI00038D63CE|nr:DMT family transporter [Paraclostridium bifermentans]EQK46440.1 eamA-like transporter family protein [[Clostridium] bifermentans ATCC 19299] [Paraclostridium bifermentans ATCC 19299]GIM31664.1 membrane protein [Paraclostridium bifermentans subsp. muricolitidis]GKZ01794.1 membrane protein [Paraclostridium bifermentans]GKZ08135.1 membrane protein [Paraclostridium bifermentans]GKZ09751.1 membrane protein [Paraclostridium bifermentans]